MRFNVTTFDDPRLHRWLERAASRSKEDWARLAAP
jgi:hypothetical protein